MEPKKLTQKERILKVLRDADGALVSSRVFYDQRLTQCNARISELRSEGYVIETVGHDEYGYAKHKLVEEPQQLSLIEQR